MTDILLLSSFILAFASAIGWLIAYHEISKAYKSKDSRSGFDVNLQSAVLGHLFSSQAAEKLGVTPGQVALSRGLLIVGIISQVALATLLVLRN